MGSVFINHANYEPELSNAIHATWSPHRDVVEYDDCYQTVMLWWYSAAGQMFVADHQDDTRLVVTVAAQRMRHYVRDERLARTGVDIGDQADYLPALVRKLLPLVFGFIEHPAVDPSAPRTQGGDPAEGNKLAAMVADLQVSLGGLSLVDREFVEAVVQYGEDFVALAGEGEAARDAKLEYALLVQRVCDELNVELFDLWSDEDEDVYDCE